MTGAIAVVLTAAASPKAEAQESAQAAIVTVSRERILREAEAPRRLQEAEATLTEQLQSQIDATKEALATEEEELARLRAELPAGEFDARVADFDRRVREARRGAQERAAVLQDGFQQARAQILAALPSIIESLRLEAGASLVLDADQILAMDHAIDMTDRAIALFDLQGPSPSLPEIDLSGPLLQSDETGAAPMPEGEDRQDGEGREEEAASPAR